MLPLGHFQRVCSSPAPHDKEATLVADMRVSIASQQQKRASSRPIAALTVWHSPVYSTLTRTSPARGGATSMVSRVSGLAASQATAALQVIGFPAVEDMMV
jgi:hypothetical protein